MVFCNTTETDEKIDETPLFADITFHRIAIIVTLSLALISTVITLYTISEHAQRYSKPWEQKHVIRILFMVPVYSITSFLSVLEHQHTIYFQLIAEAYSAFALLTFFQIICHFIGPTVHEQKEYFRQFVPGIWKIYLPYVALPLTPKKWRDSGPLRTPRSGLTWFNINYVGVSQYALIRGITVISSITAELTGRYCQTSLSPVFAHVWTLVANAASAIVAQFFLDQIVTQTTAELAKHRIAFKFWCVKLIILFSQYQTLLLSALTASWTPASIAVQASVVMAEHDITISIPAMILCLELVAISIAHLFAFSHREYKISSPVSTNLGSNGTTYIPVGSHRYVGGFLGVMALLDALNPIDIFKSIGRGIRWAFIGRKRRHHDSSYYIAKTVDQTDEELSVLKTRVSAAPDTGSHVSLSPTESVRSSSTWGYKTPDIHHLPAVEAFSGDSNSHR